MILFLAVGFLVCSCDKSEPVTIGLEENSVEQKVDTVFVTKNMDSFSQSEGFIMERLPKWISRADIFNGLIIKKNYQVENRLNPFYLEEDFNGDGILDIALPIKEISSKKLGFVIIHGGKNEQFIVGAGTLIKNALGDDQSYIDVWKLNREKENTGTELDENGDLIESKPVLLDNPSINILKTELGGGILFWNGTEYEYLHQTC